MHKSILATMVGLCFAAGINTAIAGDAEQDLKARQGTVRCGGTQFLRQNGTEVQFTSYIFRNLSSTTPITIRRLVFFDANGVKLLDTNLSGFPAFENGVLGTANQVLGANQTAQLSTPGLLPFLPDTQRPIQLEIDWAAPEKVLTLDVSLVRIARQRDNVSGQHLAERGRHLRDCRTISFRDKDKGKD